MTKIIFALFIWIMCMVVKGQPMIKNASLLDPGIPILYLGISNRIVVENGKELRLSAGADARITTNDYEKNTFFIEEKKTGFDTIRLTRNRRLIYYKIFEIKVLTQPEARIGCCGDTVMSVARILADPRLTIFHPGCNFFKTSFRVVHFTMHSYDNDRNPIEISFSGNAFGDAVKEHIKSRQSGQKIVFDNIIVTCNSCKLGKLKPLIIYIK